MFDRLAEVGDDTGASLLRDGKPDKTNGLLVPEPA